MGVAALWLVDAGTVLLVAAGGIWLGIWSPRWWRSRRRPGAQPRPSLSRPRRRPIEISVARARRLGQLHHASPHGRSRAKVEGVRQAYDDALAECCDALGIVHLLNVLAPGAELDAERGRVERCLELSGVDLHLTG
jgi:hypothetical protein